MVGPRRYPLVTAVSTPPERAVPGARPPGLAVRRQAPAARAGAPRRTPVRTAGCTRRRSTGHDAVVQHPHRPTSNDHTEDEQG